MNEEVKEMFLNDKTDLIDYLIINEYFEKLENNIIELKSYVGEDLLIEKDNLILWGMPDEVSMYGNEKEVSCLAQLFDYLEKTNRIRIEDVETDDQKIINGVLHLSYTISFNTVMKIKK